MNRIFALSAGLGMLLLAASPATTASAQSHFTECGIGEGNINNATIVVPTESTPDVNGTPLATGSEIAVYKAGTDLCAGFEVWNNENTTVTVWGDDDQTAGVEGLVPGDSMVFRVWDSVSDAEFSSDKVEFSYDPNSGLNTSGLYTHDALYVLADISVVDESLLPPAAPALIAPAHESADVSLTPDLDWDPVDYAQTYHVQVDDDAGFGSPAFDSTGVDTTAAASPSLDYQTTYHWRVRATGEGGEGDWSQTRTFTTALEPAPDAPALSAPADGAADLPLSVLLDWNEVSGANAYRVQLTDNASFTDPLLDVAGLDTTSALAADLAYGTEYSWRVRASSSGVPSAWSGVRTFTTESTPAPQAPGLTAPADGATDTPVNADLEWSAVEFAATYALEVDDNSDFSSPEFQASELAGTTETASALSNGTSYHWRVRATGDGGAGDWSETRTFTTALEPAPNAPALSLPADEAADMPLSVLLDWNQVSGANAYRVQLTDNASFSDPLLDATGLDTTSIEAADLAYGTEYFWRVRASGSGGPSAWSGVRTFTTEASPVPDAPALVLPGDGATNVPLGAELDWLSVEHATTYELQVDDSPTFDSPEFTDVDLTASSAEMSGLDNATTYHWRVRAAGSGGTGPWSSVWSLTTISEPVPDAPAPVSPADDAEDTDLSVSIEWTGDELANSYEAQIDDDDDFSSPVADESGLAETTFDIAGLDWLTTYHWRVRASGDGGISAWSTVQSFTTRQMPAPGAPLLVLPTDGQNDVSVSASIDWESADRADVYDLQIHTDPSFTAPFRNYQDLKVTARIATGLEATTEYFWRVRGRGPGGAGAWSDVRSFTTEQVADIAAPELVGPTNTMPGIPKEATLQWTAVDDAQLYHVQVDDDATFISPEFENNSLTVTSTITSELSASTHYHWRVRGSGISGNGPWSEIQTLLTQPDPPQLLTPTPDSNGVSTNAVFTWAASPGADRHYFQLDDDPEFGSPVVNLEGKDLLGASASGLESSTEYFWRVRASKNTGMGAWSPVRAFTTGLIQAPLTPTTTTPADGAVDVSTTVLLEWTVQAGAQGYRWQLDDDPEFGSPVITVQNHQSNSAAIPGLAYSRVYYWRVQAVNEGGASFWSPTASFRTVQITPPAAPSTTAPFAGEQNVSVRPTLTWSPSARSSAYEVQVDDDFGFPSPEFHSDNISGNGVSAAGLRSETFYYWRVRGLNEGGVSPWSAVAYFRTEFVPIPATPALVHPSNDAVGFTASVALNWSPIEGAYGYHLQVDDDPQFASPVMDDEQIIAESIEVAGLTANTTYNWRVRASNPGGFSIWSDARTFRTAPGAPDLMTPLHGAADIRVDVPFEWNASEGASGYRLQIDDESTFVQSIVDIEGPALSFAFGDLVLEDNTEYWWRVRSLSETGQSDWSEPFRFTTGLFMTVGTESDEVVPEEVRLDPAYPNPFSRSTTFEVHLPESSRVVMKVFDMLGREVAHLAGGTMSAGNHRIQWTPNRLSSGVYVALLKVEGQTRTRLVTMAR